MSAFSAHLTLLGALFHVKAYFNIDDNIDAHVFKRFNVSKCFLHRTIERC